MVGNILLGKILRTQKDFMYWWKESVVDKDIDGVNKRTILSLVIFIAWGIVDGIRTILQKTAAAKVATIMREKAFSNVVEQEMGMSSTCWFYCRFLRFYKSWRNHEQIDDGCEWDGGKTRPLYLEFFTSNYHHAGRFYSLVHNFMGTISMRKIGFKKF